MEDRRPTLAAARPGGPIVEVGADFTVFASDRGIMIKLESGSDYQLPGVAIACNVRVEILA